MVQPLPDKTDPMFPTHPLDLPNSLKIRNGLATVPEEKRGQLLMDMSLNIQAMISQRLIPRVGGGRIASMEILLRSPLIADLIFKGDVAKIKEVMAKSNRMGMKTFDQDLFDLYENDKISYEDAIRNADSKNELRLRIKLQSKRERDISAEGSSSLSLMDNEQEESLLR